MQTCRDFSRLLRKRSPLHLQAALSGGRLNAGVKIRVGRDGWCRVLTGCLFIRVSLGSGRLPWHGSARIATAGDLALRRMGISHCDGWGFSEEA